jgi:hypothetical protein
MESGSQGSEERLIEYFGPVFEHDEVVPTEDWQGKPYEVYIRFNPVPVDVVGAMRTERWEPVAAYDQLEDRWLSREETEGILWGR